MKAKIKRQREVLDDSSGNTNMNAEEEQEKIDDSIFQSNMSWAKDIALARKQGLEMNKTNTPLKIIQKIHF